MGEQTVDTGQLWAPWPLARCPVAGKSHLSGDWEIRTKSVPEYLYEERVDAAARVLNLSLRMAHCVQPDGCIVFNPMGAFASACLASILDRWGLFWIWIHLFWIPWWILSLALASGALRLCAGSALDGIWGGFRETSPLVWFVSVG